MKTNKTIRNAIIASLKKGNKTIAELAVDLKCHWANLSATLVSMQENGDVTLLDTNETALIK